MSSVRVPVPTDSCCWLIPASSQPSAPSSFNRRTGSARSSSAVMYSQAFMKSDGGASALEGRRHPNALARGTFAGIADKTRQPGEREQPQHNPARALDPQDHRPLSCTTVQLDQRRQPVRAHMGHLQTVENQLLDVGFFKCLEADELKLTAVVGIELPGQGEAGEPTDVLQVQHQARGPGTTRAADVPLVGGQLRPVAGAVIYRSRIMHGSWTPRLQSRTDGPGSGRHRHVRPRPGTPGRRARRRCLNSPGSGSAVCLSSARAAAGS